MQLPFVMEGRRSNFPKKGNSKRALSKKGKKQYRSEGDESENQSDDKSQISTPSRHKGGGGNKGRQLVRWDGKCTLNTVVEKFKLSSTKWNYKMISTFFSS